MREKTACQSLAPGATPRSFPSSRMPGLRLADTLTRTRIRRAVTLARPNVAEVVKAGEVSVTGEVANRPRGSRAGVIPVAL